MGKKLNIRELYGDKKLIIYAYTANAEGEVDFYSANHIKKGRISAFWNEKTKEYDVEKY